MLTFSRQYNFPYLNQPATLDYVNDNQSCDFVVLAWNQIASEINFF